MIESDKHTYLFKEAVMIYCVEDDSEILGLELYAMRTAGFEVKGFPDGRLFWEALKEEIPRLIMLDIMLPQEDGLSILKKLKSDPSTAEIPVIMATAKGSEYDKVQGLDSGADDYLVKPFSMMEMISRIKAVLRRTEPHMKFSVIKSGEILLDESKHLVTVNGQEISLTLKEYKLLKLFMENPNCVFNRDQLLESVWGINYIGESRTVDVHLGTLRTKLGRFGEKIVTVRGVGYKMIASNE